MLGVTSFGRRAVIVGLAAALSLGTAGLAAAQDKVKVAYVPIMKFATAYVAQSRGIFAKNGLEVEFEKVKSGTEAIAFLDQGSVDVGGIAIVTSLWSGWNQGLDLKIIAPGGLEPLTGSETGLYISKKAMDAGVKTVADLKGKKVGTAGGPGSGGEYLASKALARGGLTIRDVELINLANPDVPAALESGAVDAAIAAPPYAAAVNEAGSGEMVEGDLAPGLMTVAFVASGKFLAERPDVAERFVLSLVEAAQHMQGDEYLSPENMAGYLKYTASTEEALTTGQPVVIDPMMAIPVEGLKDVETTHRENGRTEYTDPLDLSKVYDDSYVKKALETLGNM